MIQNVLFVVNLVDLFVDIRMQAGLIKEGSKPPFPLICLSS